MKESKALGLTHRSAVSRQSSRFEDDFKRDAVRLVVDEKYTFPAAAKAVGVSVQSLRAWHKKFASPLDPCGENATLDELREEIKRLRKQLRRTELEREILKKATAYFAKESL
jgi:transposase